MNKQTTMSASELLMVVVYMWIIAGVINYDCMDLWPLYQEIALG